MKRILLTIAASLALAACTGERSDGTEAAVEAKSWTLADGEIFPADRSLIRAEDGVQLGDGTLIVADQRYGLVRIAPDGSHEPFGDFAAAGFVHDPPEGAAGPNGVHLEPDGRHILVADVFTGRIYRTDIETATTELVLAHRYGVNTAIADSTGAIWFTQSTENQGEERLFAAVGTPIGDGAIYRLPRDADGNLAAEPELVVDGLDFPNGFHLDEANGWLFLSETLGDRVLSFALDVENGSLGEHRVLAAIPTPDNMRLAHDGSLWVASPVSNRLFAIDLASGETRVVFDAQTEQGAQVVSEWTARGKAGEGRLDLLGQAGDGGVPGLVTGMIFGRADQPFYVSNLGPALIKIERE